MPYWAACVYWLGFEELCGKCCIVSGVCASCLHSPWRGDGAGWREGQEEDKVLRKSGEESSVPRLKSHLYPRDILLERVQHMFNIRPRYVQLC